MADYSRSAVRRCRTCQQEQPLAAFYLKTGRGRVAHVRYDSRCRACHNAKVKAYQAERADQVRAYRRQHYETKGKFATRDRSYKKFNASAAAYDLQFHAQHERCAICLRPPAEGEMRFAFDHDHATGLARGVLCPSCNGALGCLRDRDDLLLAALRYLEYWRQQHTLAEGTHGV